MSAVDSELTTLLRQQRDVAEKDRHSLLQAVGAVLSDNEHRGYITRDTIERCRVALLEAITKKEEQS